MKPEIVVLEVTNKHSLPEREIAWIKRGRSLGWPLTNLTVGGEGDQGRNTKSLAFWTEDKIALLGSMKDVELAYKLSVNPGVVSRERNRRKIPRFAKAFAKGAKAEALHESRWTKRWAKKLGTMKDRELGLQMGLSSQVVGQARRRLGIPAFEGRLKNRRNGWSVGGACRVSSPDR